MAVISYLLSTSSTADALDAPAEFSTVHKYTPRSLTSEFLMVNVSPCIMVFKLSCSWTFSHLILGVGVPSTEQVRVTSSPWFTVNLLVEMLIGVSVPLEEWSHYSYGEFDKPCLEILYLSGIIFAVGINWYSSTDTLTLSDLISDLSAASFTTHSYTPESAFVALSIVSSPDSSLAVDETCPAND